MFFRWPVYVLTSFPLLLGCGTWPFSSLPPEPGKSTVTHVEKDTSDSDQKSAGSIVKANDTLRSAEQSYGVWLNEDGSSTTWIRLEKPRFHVVSLDREKNQGWMMDGVYSFARDGTVFGVIKEIGRLPEAALAGLSWSDERLLRELPVEKVLLPFSCGFSRGERVLRSPNEPMRTVDFRGPAFKDERDRWTTCCFHQVALARPGQTHTYPPLGTWERRSDTRDRVTVHFLPDQIGVTLVEGLAGRRTRLKGECVAAADGIVYGIFTSVDRAFGIDRPKPLVPVEPFCLRMGSFANRLEIREVQALGLDEKIRAGLKGEYLPAGRN